MHLCTAAQPLAYSAAMPFVEQKSHVHHYFQADPEPQHRKSEDMPSCLKRGQLHVADDAGAGLELFPCDRGFLVQEVDNCPAQPDLQVGDVIVAIGATRLFGLAPEEVEERFGASFRNGANIIIGSGASLAKMSPEDLERDTHAILNPVAAAMQPTHDACEAVAPGLCKQDSDDGVEVGEDGGRVTCQIDSAEKWSGVRGRPGVLKGRYQFEVEVQGDCLLRVGFATLAARRVVGKDGRSFGYGGTGMKSTGGKFEPYGNEFSGSTGSIVTCLLDRRDSQQQIISFCLNGVDQGTAFTIPSQMADLPLFPALCGRGTWSALCRFEKLTYPSADYLPLAEALKVGDAIAGPLQSVKPPPGLPMKEAHALVKPGQRIALYVHTGAWQGWHTCEVLDVDALGCYLRHEDDNYTETIPWMYLKGRYRMELLPDSHVPADTSNYCTLEGLQSHFKDLQSNLVDATQKLPFEKVDSLDANLTSRQRAFIAWLASGSTGYCPDIGASETGLATSSALQEWLQALGLSVHSTAFAAWCDEQGAISLSELVEFREEVVDAFAGILSPAERTLLLSDVALSAADFATWHGRVQELASLLEMVLAEMEEDLTKVHPIRFSPHQGGKQDLFHGEQEAAQNGFMEKAKAGGDLSTHKPCVTTTTAHCVSKRDRELLRLVASCR